LNFVFLYINDSYTETVIPTVHSSE